MPNDVDERIYRVAVSSVPEQGWVVVETELAPDLPNPVLELSVLSAEKETLARTIVMDAPATFRVTLHPRGAEEGASLLLQVKLIDSEDASVTVVGEYPFAFESGR